MSSGVQQKLTRAWMRMRPDMLPFADAVSKELPLPKLLRLSLFQVSVGMATVLLIGTLNRVLIVELGMSAGLVSVMVALPLMFAPFRAMVGYKSDHHRSVLGWRRVPYIWMGTLLQFGGLAIMPFALIVMSGDTHGPVIIGHFASALAFFMVGAGLQTTQTAGLALATDLAPREHRPRVIALMYTMLLVGMVISGVAFGLLLAKFSEFRLIQVVQGSAQVTALLNIIALWKMEPRDTTRGSQTESVPYFDQVWALYSAQPGAARFLLSVCLGTAAFNMQDIILEPYGGQILHLSVSSTTTLTATLAGGTLLAFALSARALARGVDACRLAANGILVGVLAFVLVIFSAPLGSPALFRLGTPLIGFGAGLFAAGTLSAAMERDRGKYAGMALGAWGAAQAGAAGLAMALGGVFRDAISAMAAHGSLGRALTTPAAGYGFVYHIEIGLLFLTLVAIGPLVRVSTRVPRGAPMVPQVDHQAGLGVAGNVS